MKSVLHRPFPPQEVIKFGVPVFVPSSELDIWSQRAFIEPAAALVNPDHGHLNQAEIGWLWTNVPNTRKMNTVVGQAEMTLPPSSLGKWAKARWEAQLLTWFPDRELDFLITLYAPYAMDTDDLSFCSLIEHELYHCGQQVDEFGSPKFRKNGLPRFAMKGHDVEEFVGIARRYGTGASAGRSQEFVEAANRLPEIGQAKVAGVCGTCLRLAG